MPKLSVLIACYNYAHYLRPAIESVLAQDFHDFELLILDDGSQDESFAVAQPFAALDKRVKVMRQENAGVVASLNRLAQQSRGDFIAILDADNWWLPHHLSASLKNFEAFPDLVVTFARFVPVDGTGQIVDRPDCNYVMEEDRTGADLIAQLAAGNCFSSSSAVFRRSALMGKPMLRNFSHAHD